jgi:mono/diheme cytochrome c family protein
MRSLVVAFFVVVTLPFAGSSVGCGGAPASEGEGEGDEGEGEGEGEITGAHEYEVQCQICHGENGAATDIAPVIANTHADYATYVVRNGHDVMDFAGFGQSMPPFTTTDLSDDDLALILEFLTTQPLPSDGAGLYARLCINCHGSNGHNGRIFENIAGSDEVSARVRAGHQANNVASGEYMPAFTTAQLSDAQLALLADYVAGL